MLHTPLHGSQTATGRYKGGIAAAEIEFRILGPLEVVTATGRVELTAAKQRALLTILLLRANDVVSVDTLIDMLWPESPPASAAKLLQVYASQLRKALGPAGGRLLTRTPGYVLCVEPDELDSSSFERLLAEGREALASGSPARARRALVESLGLWRGQALADFAYAEFAERDAERLEHLRVVALEHRIEADLVLGRHGEVLEELQSLAEQHPLRERLRGQEMLALYRTGRQAEALASFARARRTLIDELGLEPGAELRRLQQAILCHDPELAAPLKLTPPTNLRAPLTTLVGREVELDRITELLRSAHQRLLTLTGAGGSGKTSLALAVAHAVAGNYADGAFLVELAAVQDEDLVGTTIAATLEVDREPGESVEAALARSLRGREMLLVVDNLEHLRGAAQVLVALLEAAPRLQLLVTSRVVLHVSGEVVFPVAPLAPERARELFLVRARAAAPGFSGTDTDPALVAEICRRLDHLPLALELAAPRLRTLSLEALCERLTKTLPLLTGGACDLPARQQTLRATIEWSIALLDQQAQRLLARLAVFSGGFTLEGAEAVCSGEGSSVLDLLAELVDASLVRRDEDARFELLETIRELALELLDVSGEGGEIKRRHALFLLALARSASLTTEAEGPMQHELVVPERDNVRAALRWARESNEISLGIGLVFALENHWVTAAPFEGRRWIEELLGRAGEIPELLRAQALRAYGNVLVMSGDDEAGTRAYESSLAAYRRLGNPLGVGILLQRLAGQAFRRGQPAQARALCEESLRLHRHSGFEKGESVSLGVLADLERQAGEHERARELYERSIELAERTGFVWYRASTLLRLGEMILERGRFAESEQRLKQAVPLLARMGDRRQFLFVLAMLARAAVEMGRPTRAGRLWGAIEAEESRAPVGAWEAARRRYADLILAPAGSEFEAARDQGRRLSFVEAVEVALSDD